MRGDGRVIRTLLTKLWNVLKNGTENRYISWVYRGLKCCVYLVSIILALALLLGVGHVVQYGLSAKSLSYVGSFIGPYIKELRSRLAALDIFDHDGSYARACRYQKEASALGAALYQMEEYISSI